eukprot:2673143-Ditylum_brightwellii.AAC.1
MDGTFTEEYVGDKELESGTKHQSKNEMDQLQSAKVLSLKKELQQHDISTKASVKKEEISKSLAEARVGKQQD